LFNKIILDLTKGITFASNLPVKQGPHNTVIQVDTQPGSDTLIVAFTGKAAKFNMIQPFDFFQLTGLLEYNRILVREPWFYSYLKGIDKSGLNGLVKRLDAEISAISPRKVIFMGVSAGGFASLLLGKLMHPDYVHSFSPFTYFNLANVIKNGDYNNAALQWPIALFRLNFLLPYSSRKYLDLKPLFENEEPKTKFFIHACAGSSDRTRAEHLKGCPNTNIFLYPCTGHNVTWGMVKSRCLKELLKKDNLEKTQEIYQQFYGQFDPDKQVEKNKSTDGTMPEVSQ
jgi:hypothetical protein